jgi:hypothetical protein
MSAKHGWTVRLRRRARMLGLVATLAMVASALFASSASARTEPTEHYLALGDSLAFGYYQQAFNEQIEKFIKVETSTLVPATAFEHGYANDFKGPLKKFGFTGIGLQNDGCPGETTGSALGNGPLAAALVGTELEVIEPEAPCAYHNKAAEEAGFGPGSHFPLHHEYIDDQSQIENALFTIAADAGGGAPVKVVTLNIGANDELHQVAKCEAEVRHEYETEGKSKYNEPPYAEPPPAEPTPETAVQHCLEDHAEALFGKVAHNIATMLYVLRKGHEFGGVNYEGVIDLLGSYDPYGRVFAAGEPIGPEGIYGTGTGKELLPQSTALTVILNKIERKQVTPPFGVCFASPYGRFNPGNAKEPAKLQKLTNMANFNENLGRHYGEKEADGPDIHPTKAGYAQMKAALQKEATINVPPYNEETKEYEGEEACPLP